MNEDIPIEFIRGYEVGSLQHLILSTIKHGMAKMIVSNIRPKMIVLGSDIAHYFVRLLPKEYNGKELIIHQNFLLFKFRYYDYDGIRVMIDFIAPQNVQVLGNAIT